MDTVSQIKQNLDITDVVGGYLSLKKAGKNYKALCPFHSEDSPSFLVSQELQIYKCFGCGESGDMFTFVEKMEGVEFGKALEILAEKAGIEIDKSNFDPDYKKRSIIYDINLDSAKFYHYVLLNHKSGEPGLEYFTKKRKLTKDTLKEYKLGYAPDNWDALYKYLKKKSYSDDDLVAAGVVNKKKSGDGFIDKFRGRVVFPLIDVDGKIVGFNGRDIVGRDPKYLNTADTLVFNKGSFLYGLNKAKVSIKKQGVIFVEGPMDVIIGFQSGVTNIVASSGTALTSAQLKIISRYTNEIIFSFDSDEAGMTATTRALALLNQFDFNVKIILVPQKYKDLDELFRENPAKAKAIINEPVPIYDFYIAHAIKKYDIKTAYGKKMVIDDLAPIFSKVKNAVIIDHYIKELAEKAEISPDIIQQAFATGHGAEPKEKSKAKEKDPYKELKKSSEDYLLALILRLDLDTIGQIVYKLQPQDFINVQCIHIFTDIKKYIDSKPKKFDIKYFIDSLDENTANIVKELYLWDFGDLTPDSHLFEKEINATISRLKKDYIQRELKTISEQIRLAELGGSSENVEDLQKKAKQLTEERNYYEKS